MQSEATAIHVPPSGGVSGLGVCDALRLELEPVQVPWLIDELDVLRAALEEAAHLALGDAQSGADQADDALCEREYELELLRRMRAGLLEAVGSEPTVFVAPSVMADRVVRASMRSVAAALSELADGHVHGERDHGRLERTAEAASAWVQTFLDCQAVTSFNFDPSADPGRQW